MLSPMGVLLGVVLQQCVISYGCVTRCGPVSSSVLSPMGVLLGVVLSAIVCYLLWVCC